MTTSAPRRAAWLAGITLLVLALMATAAMASPRLRAGSDGRDQAAVSAADRASRTSSRWDRLRHRRPASTSTSVVPTATTPGSDGQPATTSIVTGPVTTPPGPPTTAEPPATSVQPGATTTTQATTTTTRATTASTVAPTTAGGGAPSHFNTLPVGASLPLGPQCEAWVRALPAPPEVKGVNAPYNATRGQAAPGATGRLARVDGNFTGTTEQILRWAACKWGIDEDMVKAQAVIESWWRMDTMGDRGGDPAGCAPGHGIGADGFPGECPQSWGLLQVRYPFNQAAFPWAITSSAFNADWAYAQWRSCFEGEPTWLNTVERGAQYAAGDAWGCFGVWFSGRWYTQPARDYIARVQGTLAERTWTTANFKQP